MASPEQPRRLISDARDALRSSRLWQLRRPRRIPRRLAGPSFLREFADAYPEASFIEIGSHEAAEQDHLRPFILTRSWRGVMVEPVPYVFERLRRSYAGRHGVELENAAIANRDGRLPFYHLVQVDEPEHEGLPEWYDQLGSLSRDQLLGWSDQIPDLESRIVCTEVPCLTFESLCHKHHLDSVDLLLIDAEGYDWEIIQQIDFAAHRPRLLIYEQTHLSPDDRADCGAYLRRLGYEPMEEAFDTWCLDTRIDDPLTRAWHHLQPRFPGISDYEARRAAAEDA